MSSAGPDSHMCDVSTLDRHLETRSAGLDLHMCDMCNPDRNLEPRLIKRSCQRTASCRCNVGYAFINMLRPEYVVPLVERFNHRKWEKFNSEKVGALV